MYNTGVLGPKGLAKKLAKDTGKVAVGVPEDIIRGNVKLEASTEPPLMPSADKAISYLPSSVTRSSSKESNFRSSKESTNVQEEKSSK